MKSIISHQYIPHILQFAQIDTYDAIIVADGSGSAVGQPGGWASLIYDKRSNRTKLLCGAVSDTTVNIMELDPFVHSMIWYDKTLGADLRKALINEQTNRTINVYVVTDCKIIADQGNGQIKKISNCHLWQALDSFKNKLYKITFKWIPRAVLESNRFCDILSKRMRQLIQSWDHKLLKTGLFSESEANEYDI